MDASQRLALVLALQGLVEEHPQPCELLLSALAAAAGSSRRASVCTPYPPGDWLRQPDGDKDFRALAQALQQLPVVPALAASLEGLQDGPLQLLQWLLLSCKRTLEPWASVGLPQLLDQLRPEPGFAAALAAHAAGASAIILVGSSPGGSPGQEQQQDPLPPGGPPPPAAAAGEPAYVHCFHGTAFDCLHSILHHGLLNLSGMRLQQNGALFGQGVYLSADFDVAFSFSKAARGLEGSSLGCRLRVVLVCRVPQEVHQRVASKRRLPEKYIVVPQPSSVTVQALLVYCDDALVGMAPRTLQQPAQPPAGANPARAQQAGVGPEHHPQVPKRPRGGHGAQQLCWWLVMLYGACLIGLWFVRHVAQPRYNQQGPW